MNDPKPTNPFLAARRDQSINVTLRPSDVRALRPNWDDDQARAFLERHAAVLAHTMLAAGAQTLEQLLEGHP